MGKIESIKTVKATGWIVVPSTGKPSIHSSKSLARLRAKGSKGKKFIIAKIKENILIS